LAYDGAILAEWTLLLLLLSTSLILGAPHDRAVVPESARVIHAHLCRGVWEVSVHWVGHSAEDATWKPLLEFTEHYPKFQLEDELFQKGNLCLVKCCGCSISRQAIYAQEGDFEVMIELVSLDIVCVVRLDLLQIDMEMSFKLMGL